LFFLLMFYGAKSLIGSTPGSGGTLSGIVVGFLMWILALFAYSDMSQDLVRESSEGTLEQLAMSPMGLPKVLIARFIAGVGVQMAMLLTLLTVMMASTGRWLNFDVVSILPILIVTMLGVLGLGFIFGGMAIVFKRVQSLLQVMQFVFPVMIVFPIEKFPFLRFVPLAWGNRLMNRVMVDGVAIWQMPVIDLAILVVAAAAWLGLGIWVFKRFELIARTRGLLAQY
ncbi:MAG: ABC transporter permease, partial [Acidimicrobiia bacterium]